MTKEDIEKFRDLRRQMFSRLQEIEPKLSEIYPELRKYGNWTFWNDYVLFSVVGNEGEELELSYDILTMSDYELKEYIKRLSEEKERQREIELEHQNAVIEESERAMYEKLKKKFEANDSK